MTRPVRSAVERSATEGIGAPSPEGSRVIGASTRLRRCSRECAECNRHIGHICATQARRRAVSSIFLMGILTIYEPTDLKKVYRVLQKHLLDHPELMDSEFLTDLQHHLQYRARREGI